MVRLIDSFPDNPQCRQHNDKDEDIHLLNHIPPVHFLLNLKYGLM